ncbi:SsgA family sporulation/cell division regulator [Streptomyces sp. NBC_01264]|uniref:SsgA family sporulation/cell division regulator n=1 Tax=Streptomyces sp. NBC_01264 TaxID=2903804 RepID=UPI0033905469
MTSRGQESYVVTWSDNESAEKNEPRSFIRLESPEGAALLSLPKNHVQEFLEQSQKLVAFGSEHEYIADQLDGLEAQLGRLMRFPGRASD